MHEDKASNKFPVWRARKQQSVDKNERQSLSAACTLTTDAMQLQSDFQRKNVETDPVNGLIHSELL